MHAGTDVMRHGDNATTTLGAWLAVKDPNVMMRLRGRRPSLRAQHKKKTSLDIYQRDTIKKK